ncbi:segregation/condensation protein A [Hyphomicrobium methylovorum]|uniref:segregation and condensation protein A n=1 Tax=Hyphomicrobium methylovorum TaxID=84 RepID=UPI0015E65A07|nr:ScpA family protein [Hyphomicrobium methylovorum]MBA2127531.1 segregation/condensation protein A [Hyphomicrobium methylovorum]
MNETAAQGDTPSAGEPGAGDWGAADFGAPAFESLPAADEAFVVDIEGFEGPLDLLLAMARTQKVDLSKISILALVEQYLGFISEVQELRIEIAADYLVMAAWLAYLKSRLLLPKEKDEVDTTSAEELAQRLAFRLMRLDAMRDKAASLMTRRRLGQNVFPRGAPERVHVTRDTTYTATIYDLLKAYADQRKRTARVVHVVKARRVWSIKEARQRLERLVGATEGAWEQLDLFLEQYLPRNEEERSALASSFGATLEMAREGLIELRQDEPFAPIYMRKREAGATWEKVG